MTPGRPPGGDPSGADWRGVPERIPFPVEVPFAVRADMRRWSPGDAGHLRPDARYPDYLEAKLDALAGDASGCRAVARGLGGKLSIATPSRAETTGAAVLAGLVYLQIVAGAFVAGLDAGFGYNTWPLMEGALVPAGLGAMDPWWRNVFENTLTVQFVHRTIAYAVTLYAAWLVWRQSRAGGFAGTAAWLPRIGLLIVLQVGLGITTLLLVVPLPLALAHQALAFMLFGTCIAYLADIWRAKVR